MRADVVHVYWTIQRLAAMALIKHFAMAKRKSQRDHSIALTL